VTDRLDFDQILNSCLDRLHDGDSLDSCLASYPSHAEQLEPLLRTSLHLHTSEGPVMSGKGFTAGEALLLNRATELRARQPKTSSPRRKGFVSGLMGSTRRLILATVAGMVLLCSVLGAGTVSAASGSLPGSPLYPVKRATESVVSSLAPSPQLRARAHLNWAERRLREVEALMERDGIVDQVILTDLEEETQQALFAAEQAGSDSLTAIVTHTGHQQEVLSELIERAPEAARPGLERALEASAQGNNRARSALNAEEDSGQPKSPGPPITPPGQDKDKPSKDDAPQPPTGDEATDTPTLPAGTDEAPPLQDDQDEDELPGDHGLGRDKDEIHDPEGNHGHETDEPSPPGQNKDEDSGKDSGQGNGPDHEPGTPQGKGPGDDKDPGKAFGPPGDTGQGNDKDKDKDKDTGKDKDKDKKEK
jgi:hypothetical protein